MHMRGWVHLDISPRNVLVEGGVPYLVDYGPVRFFKCIYLCSRCVTRVGEVPLTALPHDVSSENALHLNEVSAADDAKGIAKAFGPDNAILPQGRGVEIMSRFVRDSMVNVTCPEGPVRCWASASKDGGSATVWLVNRDLLSKTITLKINGPCNSGTWSTWVLSGTNPNDTSPLWGEGQPVTLRNGSASITLPPLSITAIYH